MEQIVTRLEATFSSLWNIVRWITFFFKLVSLAFVVPVAGLIIFDFCLWLWRVYRPSLPADSPRAIRLPDYVQSPPPTTAKASSTAIDPGGSLRTADNAQERRASRI
ncbi:hypothetical protein GGR50DRAFT_79197 [Xylaria sp. CBS 124048]|nr:hypothetical protein GGR50DRAFT_79197 [Xylaria sp. CBS 124048]